MKKRGGEGVDRKKVERAKEEGGGRIGRSKKVIKREGM